MQVTRHTKRGLYEKIYSAVVSEGNLLKPDLVIYLQASVEVLVDRIRKRGRDFEKPISKDYIYRLSQGYNYYFSHFIAGIPLAIVNTDEVDLVKDKGAYETVKNFVLNLKGGTHYLTPTAG